MARARRRASSDHLFSFEEVIPEAVVGGVDDRGGVVVRGVDSIRVCGRETER